MLNVRTPAADAEQRPEHPAPPPAADSPPSAAGAPFVPLSREAADDIVREPAATAADGPSASHIVVPAGAHRLPRGEARDAPPPPKAGGANLRRAARVKRKSRAQLLLYPSGRHPHPIDVTIVDYSATGIGVVHTVGLLVGQKFIVREPHVTRDNTCLYTVVRSEPMPDGRFSIGMHIGNSLADEHDPLLTIEPAPGVSLGSKLLFLAFAVLGVTTILLVALMRYWYPQQR
jgi:hypothetical protein